MSVPPPIPPHAIAGRRRLTTALIAAALILISALGCAAAFYSNRHLNSMQGRLVQLYEVATQVQRLELLLAEAQVSIRQWLLDARTADRDASLRSTDQLREPGRRIAAQLEDALRARGLPALGALLEHELRVREQVHGLVEQGRLADARTLVAEAHARSAARQMMRVLEELNEALRADQARLDQELREGQAIGLGLIGGSSLAMLVLLLAAVALLTRKRRAAERSGAALDRRGQEVATLFRMGELLQSTVTPEDVRRIVSHTAEELLPDLSGAFYVFNNSRDRLDILGLWGHARLPPDLPEYLTPNECWALKRGRLHGRGIGDTLACDHAGDAASLALCVPMQARGEVYGLLQFYDGGEGLLPAATVELAQALADGVSLALANLALREKLRNQALRDELTGLYNRRFLDETLPRLVAHAERRAAPVSVLMLDLDHFKQVNDRHGHAVGDAVLREVGGLLLSRLRRMDIACRYGGEELIVLLPDCPAMDALARANEICAAVRGLRDRAESTLPPVTLSIGVAAWPDHGEQIGKVIEAADAALYAAKRGGRDRAMPAEVAAPALPLAAE
jgi:diguanylate cyclase (GGDEF)-like protein